MGSLSVPRLSIIIPTLGNWEVLENTLVSVLQNRPSLSEVVVVHNSHYEDPYDLKDEVRFVEAPSGSRLVDLINAGLAAARSELIHVLACGAVVDDGCEWLPGGRERAHVSGRSSSDLETNGRWTGPDTVVAFYRRSALGEVGTFDATLSPTFA